MTPSEAYAQALALKPKANKYGAKKREVDGITFHSSKEANRYIVLKMMQGAGVIENLELQKRYKCTVNGTLICTYVADFDYDYTALTPRHGEHTTEDVKGAKTALYRLKKKLMAACHPGVKIIEV